MRPSQSLAAAFDCPVGFSDHSEGNVAGIGAVALSAWQKYRRTPVVDTTAPNGRVVAPLPVAIG